jgi:RNA polymerase sigma-70 factor (ECF subfamily)
MAAIAACHATAPNPGETDWAEIATLYDRLHHMNPSPVIALNRAVAVAMTDGPQAGLALIDQIEQTGVLADYYLLPATRADFLRRLGQIEEARELYRRARRLAPTDTERRYLTRRIDEGAGQE